MVIMESIHIGVSRASPGTCCNGDDTGSSENDAQSLAQLATTLGFISRTVLVAPGDATRTRLIGEFDRVVQKFALNGQEGGLLLLTFAGHGCRKKVSSPPAPLKGKADTWCLHDGQFHDYELLAQLARFRSTDRIVILSDSCHSGGLVSVFNLPALLQHAWASLLKLAVAPLEMPLPPGSPGAWAFDSARWRRLKAQAEQLPSITAHVLLLSSSEENQSSSQTEHDGVFTAAILAQAPTGFLSYLSWFEAVKREVHKKPDHQSPGWIPLDGCSAFWNQTPFNPAPVTC
ncbi:MAG TPA: caspase family protein [Longimicrobium sp.]|jgi:hypothetical protein|nr:caspase family protein [Longimicrobium sp.]